MKNTLAAAIILIANVAFAQTEKTISIIDFVKIKNNKSAEALYYYENNWKVFRDVAIKQKYIKGYKLMTSIADTTAAFDIILITEFADSAQYALSEPKFQQIIKSTRPDGLKLLNKLTPADFRQNLFFKKSETLFSGNGQ